MTTQTIIPNESGYYGEYGGMFIPEILRTTFDELIDAFAEAKADPEFWQSFVDVMQNYSCRPTPVTPLENFANSLGSKFSVFCKREDLNHTGAHKANNCMGQGLLVKRMGKTRVIAETGAGQHGVATATMAARMGPAWGGGCISHRWNCYSERRNKCRHEGLGRKHGNHSLCFGHNMWTTPLPGNGCLVSVDHRSGSASANA